MIRRLTVLGSTGSIGVSTLDVVARHRDHYEIVALTAHQNIVRLAEQCAAYEPRYAVVADPGRAESLRAMLAERALTTEVLLGEDGLSYVAGLAEVDTVVAAIVGAAGLLPTLAAANGGKRILLANKEALIMSGQLFMDAVRASGAELLPVDSEHNAIFQSLPETYTGDFQQAGITKIVLTASGGPFRRTPLEALSDVTPDEACAHPNWDMGRKISVDSATMMNKNLEVIEACWLFGVPSAMIQIVLHPQSIIHSMVQYIDGSVVAELGNPDMRTPIAHALACPRRMDAGVAPLDFFEIAGLDFERPDFERFPCLKLAPQVIDAGGTSSAIMNAANEVAVQAFLDGSIRFTEIVRIIEATLAGVTARSADSIAAVLAADTEARQFATAYYQGMTGNSPSSHNQL